MWFCTADCGWITGHSYVAYGPLLNGATQLIFEGVPSWPDAGRLWRVVDEHKVTHLYTAPTAIRALMRAGDAPVRDAPSRRTDAFCFKTKYRRSLSLSLSLSLVVSYSLLDVWSRSRSAPSDAGDARESQLAQSPRLRRRTHQPRGLALVPRRRRRQALPHRRHALHTPRLFRTKAHHLFRKREREREREISLSLSLSPSLDGVVHRWWQTETGVVMIAPLLASGAPARRQRRHF